MLYKKSTIIIAIVIVLALSLWINLHKILKTGREMIIDNSKLISDVIYSANVVLLDNEQEIQNNYANMLKEAVSLVKKGSISLENIRNLYNIDGIFIVNKQGRGQVTNKFLFSMIKDSLASVEKDFSIAKKIEDYYVYSVPYTREWIIVAIRTDKVDARVAKYGLEHFFDELSKQRNIYFVLLQDSTGTVFSTINSRYMQSFIQDTFLFNVYANGVPMSREITLNGRKVIETVSPFSYRDFRGVMRIGVLKEPYTAVLRHSEREVIIIHIIILIAGIILVLAGFNLSAAKRSINTMTEMIQAIPIGTLYLDNNGNVIAKNSFADKIAPNYVAFAKYRDILDKLEAGSVFESEEREAGIHITYFKVKNGYVLLIRPISEIDAGKKLKEYEVLGNISAEIAHEIKNPLNAISMTVQQLNMEGKREEYNIILREIARIEESINRFVAIAAPLRLRRECLDIFELVDEAVKLFKNNTKHVDIINKTEHIKMLADRYKIREVVVNLIKNALEASFEKGEIIIYSRVSDKYLSVFFEDKGSGMDKTTVNRIFEPFFTTKKGGAGLGLYYVKKVVESHSGKIFISSSTGNGTKIELRFIRDENIGC